MEARQQERDCAWLVCVLQELDGLDEPLELLASSNDDFYSGDDSCASPSSSPAVPSRPRPSGRPWRRPLATA